MSGRRGIAAGVVVAVLALAGAATAILRPANGPRVAPPDRTVMAELLVFRQGHGLPSVSTVLRSRTDARAVRGWFAETERGAPDADDIERLAGRRDYGREAVVLFSYTGGCDTARGARLTSDGPGRLNMDLTGVTEHGECDTPYKNLAMFAVDKAKAPPGGLTLGGTRTGSPDPVSPGKLVAFEKLAAPPPRSARAAEVSQPDQLEGFLKSLPGARLGGGTPGQRGGRRFAFVLSGCAARTAIMMIDENRLAAEPVGDGITRCEIAEHYAAVFTVEAQNVPPTARIG
ncbi:hypothetical protein [Actinomadura welshii]|uniref:hypothetical protein n=1 Tax=Actinomadura welshii TaxID=3103817 RepID=UPI001268133E|nr:hypothetical protein [Actinomadura madurae]